MNKKFKVIFKVLIFVLIVQGFIFTKSVNAQAAEGTVCNPYTITICNICGGDYSTCAHRGGEGLLFGTECKPYLMCNICYHDKSTCSHIEGDTYGGTVCSPDPNARLCNICHADYDIMGGICTHWEGVYYDGTEISFSYGRICNICRKDYAGCSHYEGSTYYDIVCSPFSGELCSCSRKYTQCHHSLYNDNGEMEFYIYSGRVCNICLTDYDISGGICTHWEGQTYETTCMPDNSKICNICSRDIEYCGHIPGQIFGGTLCQPYSATVCNICHRNYDGCDHYQGHSYEPGLTVCIPYYVCNCGEKLSDCGHTPGDIFEGTICNPFTKTICNICGNNYGSTSCSHRKDFKYLFLTQTEIDNNIRVTYINDEPYYDYTEPINKMVMNNFITCEMWRSRVENIPTNLVMFYEKVKTNGEWDIKVRERWRVQFGDAVKYVDYFVFNGEVITPSKLGNITYGFWGRATGFGSKLLYWGGGFAAQLIEYKNELSKFQVAALPILANSNLYYGDYLGDIPDSSDHDCITQGIEWYNSTVSDYEALNFNPTESILAGINNSYITTLINVIE